MLAAMNRFNFYAAGSAIDRAEALRKAPDWLERVLADPGTRVVPVWRSRNLVAVGDMPQAVRLALAEARALLARAGAVALLGVVDGAPHVAVDLSALDETELAEIATHGEFTDLRSVGPLMERTEGSLLAYARGLMWWHARHGFCGVCGAPTEVRSAGHVRHCTNPACGADHFPRTDPAVIMLVHDGPYALLGRNARFAGGMYSTLAGFVEPGESLEEAVIREVREEAGVRVGAVHYHSSQPWPFPASIMIGFHCTAESRDITIDPEELTDAQWFHRDRLLNFEAEGKRLPRADSIARRLIEDWLANR
ncbi:MAG: hypothetical protein OHK0024_12280 [Thalassobaculales bacterium]